MKKDRSLEASRLLIRPLQPDDWQRVTQIHDAARPDELAGSCDPRAFIPLAKDPEFEDLKKCQILVAILDSGLVGFVGVDNDYLGWLYVDPEYYGQGIGRKLLQAGLKLVTGTAWTIALAGNTRAVRLYESQGFKETSRFQSDNAGYPCICLRLERQTELH